MPLAMWWVPTQPEEALQVMRSWGFRLMTMKGFTWHKTNRVKGKQCDRYGSHDTRQQRGLFICRQGKLPPRIDASICQHVTAPRMEHSAKPDAFREKLVQLLGMFHV